MQRKFISVFLISALFCHSTYASSTVYRWSLFFGSVQKGSALLDVFFNPMRDDRAATGATTVSAFLGLLGWFLSGTGIPHSGEQGIQLVNLTGTGNLTGHLTGNGTSFLFSTLSGSITDRTGTGNTTGLFGYQDLYAPYMVPFLGALTLIANGIVARIIQTLDSGNMMVRESTGVMTDLQAWEHTRQRRMILEDFDDYIRSKVVEFGTRFCQTRDQYMTYESVEGLKLVTRTVNAAPTEWVMRSPFRHRNARQSTQSFGSRSATEQHHGLLGHFKNQNYPHIVVTAVRCERSTYAPLLPVTIAPIPAPGGHYPLMLPEPTHRSPHPWGPSLPQNSGR